MPGKKEDPASPPQSPVVNVADVVATINRARAVYGAARLEDLPSGIRLNPSHCPIARAFRMGVSQPLFFAVGSEGLRVEALGWDPAEIAHAIKAAWYGPAPFVEGDPLSSVVHMPSELRSFVKQFDAGKLPSYVGVPEGAELATVTALARKIADAKAVSARDSSRIRRGSRTREKIPRG